MQSKIRFLLAGVVLFILIGGWFSIGLSKSETKIIKIGALLPLTGNTSFLGEFVKSGIDLAVEDLNREGGINGAKVQIEYGDSKNDPKEGVAIFNKFVSFEGIPCVISAMTAVTQAVIPVADKGKTVLFATTVSASGVTEQSPWVFRLFITADIDAKTMGAFAAGKLGLKKAGILYVNDDFGQSFSRIFKETFEGKGGKIVSSESYEKGQKDFRTILLKMKGSDAGAIYLLGYDNNLGVIPKQMRELGIKLPILSIGTIAQPNVLAQAGDAVEGTIFTTTEFSADSPKTEKAKRFIENYKKKFDKDPSYFSAFSYDAVLLLADAIKKYGYSNEGIRKGLLEVKGFGGVTGVITIKPNGDADFPMVIKKIHRGKIEDVF